MREREWGCLGEPSASVPNKSLGCSSLGGPGSVAHRPNAAATQPAFWMPWGGEQQGQLHFCSQQGATENHPVPPASAFQTGLLVTQVRFCASWLSSHPLQSTSSAIFRLEAGWRPKSALFKKKRKALALGGLRPAWAGYTVPTMSPHPARVTQHTPGWIYDLPLSFPCQGEKKATVLRKTSIKGWCVCWTLKC